MILTVLAVLTRALALIALLASATVAVITSVTASVTALVARASSVQLLVSTTVSISLQPIFPSFLHLTADLGGGYIMGQLLTAYRVREGHDISNNIGIEERISGAI